MTVRAMWAQALDNTSPDEIEIPAGDMTREEAVAHVYRVIELGKRVHASKNVKLISYRNRSVLEIISTVHDQAGRSAPIVCYLRHEGSLIDEYASEIAASAAHFCAKIGRRLPESYAVEISAAIDALKKNSRTKLTRTLWVVTIAGAVLAVLAYETYSARLSGASLNSGAGAYSERNITDNSKN